LPLTRTNEAEEKLRGAKGRLKTPSSVVTVLNSSASKKTGNCQNRLQQVI
jgi:hypothetical protein